MRITKRNLLKIIREEKRRLREDSIDDELDNLHKNIGDDLEHIRDLKDDIKDDHEEELHAEEERRERAEERHDESFRRRNIRRSVRRIMREERDADWGMDHMSNRAPIQARIILVMPVMIPRHTLVKITRVTMSKGRLWML